MFKRLMDRIKFTKYKPWYEEWDKKQSILENLHDDFRCLIAHLIYDKKWHWLEAIISSLCDFEMYIRICGDKDFKELLDTVNVCTGPEEISYAQQIIPDDPLYCDGCEFRDHSSIADFFYGHQCAGYCYYMGKGDFSFCNPTSLLWDGCKECGVNENWEALEAQVDEWQEQLKLKGKNDNNDNI